MDAVRSWIDDDGARRMYTKNAGGGMYVQSRASDMCAGSASPAARSSWRVPRRTETTRPAGDSDSNGSIQ